MEKTDSVSRQAAYAWGFNRYGQLGDGTTTDRLTPGQVGSGAHWASVAAGDYHTVALAVRSSCR
jgi:alpha-tubulin suppressor-like RCC1 family protein